MSSSHPSSGVKSTLPTSFSTHSTYHPGGYGVSEGLKRARRPFAVRNALTGAAILGFCTTVYFYSISKVKQDDFSDLGELPAATSTPISSSIQSSQPSEISSSNSLASKISSQASSITNLLPSKASQPTLHDSVAETARAEILRRQGRL